MSRRHGRAGRGGGARSGAVAGGGGSRARAKLRRYCAANRLNRFGTLTYADELPRSAAAAGGCGGFFRGLRRELGGERLPYAWTSEWHPGGHGLHVHFAVGRYVRQRLIRDVWGRGFVHIKLIGDLPLGSGALEEARVAAGYLAKYASKSLDDERRAAGLHRYEVAQGFQPQRVRLPGAGRGGAAGEAARGWARDRRGSGAPRGWRAGRGRRRSGVPGLTEKQIAEIRARGGRLGGGAGAAGEGAGRGDPAAGGGACPAGSSRAR